MDYESRRRYGEIIGRAIAQSGLTKEEVARRADVSSRTVSNVTNGKTAGQADILAALTDALADELRALLIRVIAEKVRVEKEARDSRRSWIESTAKVEAAHETRRAIENGTFDDLMSRWVQDLEHTAEQNGQVPELEAKAAEYERDLEILRHWIAGGVEGIEGTPLPSKRRNLSVEESTDPQVR